MKRGTMKRVVSAEEAASFVRSGDTVMIGGFIYGGVPYTVIDALLARGTDRLTMISVDEIGRAHV